MQEKHNFAQGNKQSSIWNCQFGILPRKETPGRTEDDHIEDSEQHTTQEEQNSPNLLASELKDPSSQDDLSAPFENANAGQPSVADLQVEPSVENRNKRKYAIHECVTGNQESYNKKMKKSRNKVEDFKIDEFVSIKIDKVDKTSPLHPNVLLAKVTEVDDNYAKIVTKFGIISTYISISRLNKCTQTSVTFDYSKEITFSAACEMAVNQ